MTARGLWTHFWLLLNIHVPARWPRLTLKYNKWRRREWGHWHQRWDFIHSKHCLFSEVPPFFKTQFACVIREGIVVSQLWCWKPSFKGNSDMVVLDGTMDHHQYTATLWDYLDSWATPVFGRNLFSSETVLHHILHCFSWTVECQMIDWTARSPVAITNGCVRNDNVMPGTVLLDCTMAKPWVQSNNTSRVHFAHTRSRFYHTHIVYKWNLDGSCLVNWYIKVTFSNIFCGVCNFLRCFDESCWNMSFKGTWHGDIEADGTVAPPLWLWQYATILWRHAVWIRIVASDNAWMGNEC